MRPGMFSLTARAPFAGSRALIRCGARFLVIFGIILGASLFAEAQQTIAAGQARPAATAAPLFFKVEWVQPRSQADTSVRYSPVQENIADPNVEIKFYGAAKQILTTGAPGSEVTPYGVWSGTATAPFAVTFRQKNNYVDLTGIANIRWFTKTSGFHVIRPVVKLAVVQAPSVAPAVSSRYSAWPGPVVTIGGGCPALA